MIVHCQCNRLVVNVSFHRARGDVFPENIALAVHNEQPGVGVDKLAYFNIERTGVHLNTVPNKDVTVAAGLNCVDDTVGNDLLPDPVASRVSFDNERIGCAVVSADLAADDEAAITVKLSGDAEVVGAAAKIVDESVALRHLGIVELRAGRANKYNSNC